MTVITHAQVKKETVKKTELIYTMPWEELREIILKEFRDYVIQNHQDLKGRKSYGEIKLKQMTEGSPAYNINKWNAEIIFVVDLGDLEETK